MSTEVSVTLGEWNSAYCFSTYEDLRDTIIGSVTWSIEGITNSYNFGPTTPGVDERDRIWERTDSNYNEEGLFVWSTQYSAWLRRHPLPPNAVIMWTGAIAGIDTFDGGEAGVVTATTGPIWEKYAAMDGRFPIAPGTLDQGTVVALAGTGGTEKVSLIEAEMPPHTHDIKGRMASDGFTAVNLSPNHILIDDDWKTGTQTKSSETAGGSGGTVTPHQNLPPYLAVNFIRRTARLYLRAV